MQEITNKILEEARRLFSDGLVDVVIGYQQGYDDTIISPCFVDHASQVDKLVFNERCTNNLARYLVGREGYLTSRFRPAEERPRVALVAGQATMRAIVGLIQEHQLKREDVYVLGIVDGSAVGIEPDVQVGQVEQDLDKDAQIRARIEELEALPASERWNWWRQEFSKCIRCYACRQACPFCYCEECIVDENRPQWIGKSPLPRNNTSWNVIRAFHLVGRCIGCHECERACPVNIPLSLLNTKMAAEVEEMFGYVTGTDTTAVPALATFQVDDTNDTIR